MMAAEIREPRNYLYDSIYYVFNVGYSLFATCNFLPNLFIFIWGRVQPSRFLEPLKCFTQAVLLQADTKGVSVLKSEDFAAWYTQAPQKWPCALLFFGFFLESGGSLAIWVCLKMI